MTAAPDIPPLSHPTQPTPADPCGARPLEEVLKEARAGQGTLTAAFFARAQAQSAQVAMRRKELGIWEEVTWAQYRAGVNAVAAALIDMGVRPGEPVGLISENRAEWLMTDLGILASGAVTCAMYTTSAASQVEYVMGHAGIRFLFVENEEQLDKALEIRKRHPICRVVVFDEKGLGEFDDPDVVFWSSLMRQGPALLTEHGGEVAERSVAVKPNDLAILVYTSGTTGPPKGVMLSHGNIAWICRTLAEHLQPHADDELLSFLPLCHVAERMITVFNQVMNGSVVNFAENLDTVRDNLGEVRPHVFFAVPRIWEKLYNSIELKMRDATFAKRQAYAWALRVGAEYTRSLRQSSEDSESASVSWGLRARHWLAERSVLYPLRHKLGFDRTRFALSGAAPISPEVIEYFQSLGIPLVEGYGQTESAGVITLNPPGFRTPGTVGVAISGLELRIAEDGEILARSPGVMMGYYKEPEATAAAVTPEGWLCTGDIGQLDSEGCLTITDRKKDLIITAGGKNIAPQFIESKLRLSAYIHDAVVIGDARKYITALVILDEDNLVEWAQTEKVQFGAYADLARSPDVEALMRREIETVNQGLTHVEAVKKFRILERRLDKDDGELTPTLKVRRKFVEKKYATLIDAMY